MCNELPRYRVALNDFQKALEFNLAHKAHLSDYNLAYKDRLVGHIHVVEALTMATIISYMRPFQRNDPRGSDVAPRVEESIYLDAYSQDRRDLHAKFKTARNSYLAHSDWDTARTTTVPAIIEGKWENLKSTVSTEWDFSRDQMEEANLLILEATGVTTQRIASLESS